MYQIKDHASILLEDKELLQEKMEKIREKMDRIFSKIHRGRIDPEEGFEKMQILHYDLDYLQEQVDQIHKDIQSYHSTNGGSRNI